MKGTSNNGACAVDGSRAALRATAAKLGFLPSAMARLAESPALVAAFGKMMALRRQTSLAYARLEALRQFITRAVLASHGGVTDEQLGAFLNAPLQRFAWSPEPR